MVRLKVIGCGYRNWSMDIFKHFEQREDVDLTIISSPDDVTDKLFEQIQPDIVFFYGWSWIVSDSIIDKWMCLCLHPSPLPLYRGGSPIQHQIIRGEKTSCVSIFKMTHELDAGPLCFQENFPLDGNIQTIFEKIKIIGIKGTEKIISDFSKNTLNFYSQKGTPSTFKRRKPSDSEITFDEIKSTSALNLYNKIRMLTDPYPNAFIVCGDGKKLFLTESKIDSQSE